MSQARQAPVGRFLGLMAALLLSVPLARAVEPIRAETEDREAWVAERVVFSVTLYSRGPFSGVASFDLPELPRTLIVAMGSPLIGSESIEGETWLTQRHEFALYTWREGEVIIPPFDVRFRNKESFTSDAKATEGTTPELRFESRRPPDVSPEDEALPATDLTFTQSWSPEQTESLAAGDVLERTLTRRATDTAAMMLPPLEAIAQAGVKTYATPPLVDDRTERGETTAVRREVIKHQFVRPGEYELPALTVEWWDTKSEELKQATVPGKRVRVEGAAASEAEATPDTNRWPSVLLALLTLGAVVMAGGVLHRRLLGVQRPEHDEAITARRVLAACRQSDPEESYMAVLEWFRAVEALQAKPTARPKQEKDFEDAWRALSRTCYGETPPTTPWSGGDFAACFKRQRRHTLSTGRPKQPALGPLNPGSCG